MELKNIKEYLPKVFEIVDKDQNTERIVFNSDVMSKENINYPIYRAISDAQHDSGLSFNFSYEIASRAVDILSEIDDWNDDDAVTEAVDSSVPIYNNVLMKIYQSDHWAVDEAVKEMGIGDDSIKNAQYGWYMQIEQMTEAIKSNLLELVEAE